mgnify:FL=1
MFKWPYASRGATQKAEESASKVDQSDLDFTLFASNDAFIKVWLPDRLATALDRLSAKHGSSRPDVLRTILFQHIYGVTAYEDFIEWKEQLTKSRAKPSGGGHAPGIKLSPSRSHGIETLGKSDTNFKFWIPARLKQDLSTLAKADGLGISDYVRKVLVRLLLGERFFADWQNQVGQVPYSAKSEEALQ